MGLRRLSLRERLPDSPLARAAGGLSTPGRGSGRRRGEYLAEGPGYAISRFDMAGQGARPQIDLAKSKRVPDDDGGLSPQKVSRKTSGTEAGVTAAELQAMLLQQTTQLSLAQDQALAKVVEKSGEDRWQGGRP